MKLEAIGKPFTYQWPGGQIRFEPGRVIDVPEDRAVRIMAKVPGRVRPVEPVKPSTTPPDDGFPFLSLRPGDHVEWMSPALPRQQAEVLAVYDDGTFEAFHPLTGIVRRMPTAWITRNITTAPTQEGPTHED